MASIVVCQGRPAVLFYRCFIRNFSIVAVILLTRRVTLSRFQWNPKAEKAFSELKRRICSQPILITPNPSLPFVVEVDASEVGVGAILSHRSPLDNKLHPCLFLPVAVPSRETSGTRSCWLSSWHWRSGATG